MEDIIWIAKIWHKTIHTYLQPRFELSIALARQVGIMIFLFIVHWKGVPLIFSHAPAVRQSLCFCLWLEVLDGVMEQRKKEKQLADLS